MARFSLKLRPPLFSNWRIKHKVFALISLIMAVCFLITYISLQYAYSIYDGQLYSKSSQLLGLSSSGIEGELKKLDRLSFTIATDLQVQSLLSAFDDHATEFEKYRIRSGIADRLVQYSGYEKYIFSISVIDPLGEETVAGQTSRFAPGKLRQVLEESGKGLGETRWILPDEGDPYVTAAREIRSYQNNLSLTRLGTLTVRIRFDKIVEDIVAGTELKNGEMRIVSGTHTIYPQTPGEAFGELPGGNDFQQGYVIQTVNGRQYFTTQIQSGEQGWTYRSYIPFDQIFNKIIWMKNILLIGFIVSLLAVMALALQFARSVTRPIEELIARMRQAQKGNFSEAAEDAAEWGALPMDEVGQLQRTFRMMIQQINELITENYAKQLTIKETEFKALQAQINPHFLYNTLDSINWLAKAGGQKQISSMVEALGGLLRSSISLTNTLIPLREELEIVMHYITIQRFRFEDRLHFETDIPEEAMGLPIPKLTLQPLLENAIHYGVESMLEPCELRIRGRREQGAFVLTVEDNGPGMSPELLEQVRRGEARTRGSGIGLKNIEERIVLAFGGGYGIRLESEQGRGTAVSVIIPDKVGTNDV